MLLGRFLKFSVSQQLRDLNVKTRHAFWPFLEVQCVPAAAWVLNVKTRHAIRPFL